MECDKFETMFRCLPSGDPTIPCVFMKNEKESTLIIIPFKIYLKPDLENFPIQKAIHLFSFLSQSKNVEKVYQRPL